MAGPRRIGNLPTLGAALDDPVLRWLTERSQERGSAVSALFAIAALKLITYTSRKSGHAM